MAQGAPITYQVTRVTPDTQFPPGEQPVKGNLVAFTTSSGYSGSVFVPDSVFADKSAVVRMIEDQVRLVAAAQSISGTVQGL
jgi:hypothetical protein